MSTNSELKSSTSNKQNARPQGQEEKGDNMGLWMGVGMFLVIGVPMIVIMALKWMS